MSTQKGLGVLDSSTQRKQVCFIGARIHSLALIACIGALSRGLPDATGVAATSHRFVMRTENTSFIGRRIAAFRFAFAGIVTLFRTQTHSWIHLVATVAVVAAGVVCAVDRLEWCLLIFSIGLVWIAEAVNTAVEFTVDLACPETHETAGKAKDVAAGVVLLAAATAATIGLIVLGPHLWRLALS